MKKATHLLLLFICCFTMLGFTACGTEPITKLEFETDTNIEFTSEYDEAIITVLAYPSDCKTSDVTLIADKDGYIEIENVQAYISIGTNYRQIEFTIKPLYNGTIYLTAEDSSTKIVTANSIKVTISGLEEKPITDEDEHDYLLDYGWTAQMTESFAETRKQIGLSHLKEITSKSEDSQTYNFINEDNDECTVIFNNEIVTEIYDCDGKRKIYPAETNILYIKDMTTAMRFDLIDYAEEVVKSKLKSPATAEFPFLDWSYSLDTTTTNRIYVYSYVDAQNIFGAIIRDEFAIKIEYDGDETFNWVFLLLGDQMYYNDAFSD